MVVGGRPVDELVRQALAAGAFVLETSSVARPAGPDGVGRYRLPSGAPLLLVGSVCGGGTAVAAAAAGDAAGREAAAVRSG